MPGLSSHVLIADEIADRVPPEEKELLRLVTQHRDVYLLGSIAPDTFVLAPDFGDWSVDLLRILTTFYDDAVAPIVAFYDDHLRPIEEGIDALEQAAQDVLDQATCGLASGLETIAADLQANLEGVVRGLVLNLATRTVNIFDALVPPLQKGEDVDGSQINPAALGWTWFDMVHYRHTGDLIHKMWSLAKNDVERAFVLGWVTHYAADTIGHAAVNAMVGGPYRSHNQRHHFIENMLDVELCDRLRGQELIDSHLHRLLPRGRDAELRSSLGAAIDEPNNVPDELESIFDLLEEAIRATYATPPRRIQGGYLDATQLYGAYWYTLLALRVTTSSGTLQPPGPPAEDYLDTLNEAIADLMEKAGNPPQDPGQAPSFCINFWDEDCSFDLANVEAWLDYLGRAVLWLGELVVWAGDLVSQLVNVANCAVTSGVLALLRGALWAVEYALYAAMSFLREALVMNAIMPPDRLWLHTHPLAHAALDAERGVTDSALRQYPHQARPSNEGFQSYPDTPVEPEPTLAAPMDLTLAPDAFAFIASDVPNLASAYAQAQTPTETRALEFAHPDVGFASVESLSRHAMQILIEGTGDLLPNWNLDADRGYGYLTWTYEGIGALRDPPFTSGRALDEQWDP